MAAQFPYQPVGWTEGVSSLGQANLGHMDEAIRAAFNGMPVAFHARRTTGIAPFSNLSCLYYQPDVEHCYILNTQDGRFGVINPTTGEFTSLATLALSYFNADGKTLCRIDDDRMVVFGTWYSSSTYYLRGAIYAISTNTWTFTASSAATWSQSSNGRPNMVGAFNPVEGAGYAIATGLNTSPKAYRYDLAGNVWSAQMGSASQSYSAFQFYMVAFDDDGYGYVLKEENYQPSVLKSSVPLAAGVTGVTFDYCSVGIHQVPTNMMIHDGKVYTFGHLTPAGVANKMAMSPDFADVGDPSTGRAASMGGPNLSPTWIDWENGIAWQVRLFNTTTVDILMAGIFAGGVIL